MSVSPQQPLCEMSGYCSPQTSMLTMNYKWYENLVTILQDCGYVSKGILSLKAEKKVIASLNSNGDL